jgi:hypothetical protein
MEWVRLQPSIRRLVLHFPNEGKRSLRYGKFLKDLGMRSGVSDLFIPMARHGFIGCWIEIKNATGVLSPTQREFIKDMKEQGYYTAICRTVDHGIKLISWYCFEQSIDNNSLSK